MKDVHIEITTNNADINHVYFSYTYGNEDYDEMSVELNPTIEQGWAIMQILEYLLDRKHTVQVNKYGDGIVTYELYGTIPGKA